MVLLNKFLALALIAVAGISNSLVDANAGFMVPVPRKECTVESRSGCKITNPCHSINKVDGQVNPIDINDDYQYAIFQLDAKASKESVNTYTVQYFNDQDITGYQLLTFNQNDMNSSSSYYAVKMDAIINNPKIMDNVAFDGNGHAYGTLELTFDARSGGGDVYYSCASVRLQKTKKGIKEGGSIEVQATLTLTDGLGENRNETLVSDNTPAIILVPKLIDHDAKSDSSDIKAENGEIGANNDAEDAEKNSATPTTITFAISSIIAIASIVSMFI